MAIVLQDIIDSFAAKVSEKPSFITVGAQKATLEGKGTDTVVTLRVIDPTNTANASGSAVVGSEGSGNITLGELNEKKVTVGMKHYYRAIGVDIIDEAVKLTDGQLQAHLDKEAQAMAADIRKDAKSKIFKANKAFVGGWEDVEVASGELGDTADGRVLGWLSHKAKAKLSVSQPFGSQVGNILYRVDEIGQGKDGSYFYNEKTLPTITLESDTFTVSTKTVSGGTIATLAITGTTGTQTLPAGTPITLKGVKACDALGNPTDDDAVIVLKEAVAPSSKVYTLTGKFEGPITSGAGRQVAKADGSDIDANAIAGASIPAEGTYFIGYMKVENADAYASVPVKAKDSDYKEQTVDGIVFSINSFSDKNAIKMKNGYRFDCYLAQGVADPRLTALVYIKK